MTMVPGSYPVAATVSWLAFAGVAPGRKRAHDVVTSRAAHLAGAERVWAATASDVERVPASRKGWDRIGEAGSNSNHRGPQPTPICKKSCSALRMISVACRETRWPALAFN